MSLRFEAHIETQGGAGNLSRVVGVMALLDLTPLVLTSYGRPGGLSIDVQFVAGRREAELCLSRFQALVSVSSAAMHVAADPLPDG
ncbi:hypothetical protein [Phenylobacterium sp.]|uniref:hypothetical protein n=1 Tax=Phenylobacterium sp. TaxID=1871053 RepID=UPI002DF5E441|nr:hypothetical protein [Phenylobacterium sp.]